MMSRRVRARVALAVGVLGILALSACGSREDPSENNMMMVERDQGPDLRCPAGQIYSDMLRRCVDEPDMVPDMKPDMPEDMPSDLPPGDMPEDMTPDQSPDMPPDQAPDMEVDMGDPCDKDGDLALAMTPECGGDDCDDNNFARAPGRSEICDEYDNNCDMQINEGLGCQFLAHTREKLYTVNPFTKEVTELGDMPQGMRAIVDIDTAITGTIYGVTNEELYRYNPGKQPPTWDVVGAFSTDNSGPEDPNGMAIDQSGTAFVTSSDELYEVNLMTGRATLVGLVGDFRSSGDAVINKQNTLYMSSKSDGTDDELVEVNRGTGAGSKIGNITGYDRVFGLTFAWGRLWGLTVNGQLIEIDRGTAQARLVTTFTDADGDPLNWYGAASTPDR